MKKKRVEFKNFLFNVNRVSFSCFVNSFMNDKGVLTKQRNMQNV